MAYSQGRSQIKVLAVKGVQKFFLSIIISNVSAWQKFTFTVKLLHHKSLQELKKYSARGSGGALCAPPAGQGPGSMSLLILF